MVLSTSHPDIAHQALLEERTMGKTMDLKPCMVPPDTYVVLKEDPLFNEFLSQDLIMVTNGLDTYLLRIGDRKVQLQRVEEEYDATRWQHPLHGRDMEGELIAMLEGFGLKRPQIQAVLDHTDEWIRGSGPWAG